MVIPKVLWHLTEEIEMEPPRTAEPPTPPPPPVITEVPDETVVEQTKIESTESPQRPKRSQIWRKGSTAPSTTTTSTKKEEIFKIVEQMPRFPRCEDTPGDNKGKGGLRQTKMLEYIYKNVKYPPIARESSGVEGQAVIQFEPDTDGSITNITVARDPGAGLGWCSQIESTESMNNMSKKWHPGKQRVVP